MDLSKEEIFQKIIANKKYCKYIMVSENPDFGILISQITKQNQNKKIRQDNSTQNMGKKIENRKMQNDSSFNDKDCLDDELDITQQQSSSSSTSNKSDDSKDKNQIGFIGKVKGSSAGEKKKHSYKNSQSQGQINDNQRTQQYPLNQQDIIKQIAALNEKRKALDEKRKVEDEKRKAEDEKRKAEDQKRKAEDEADDKEKKMYEEYLQKIRADKKSNEDISSASISQEIASLQEQDQSDKMKSNAILEQDNYLDTIPQQDIQQQIPN